MSSLDTNSQVHVLLRFKPTDPTLKRLSHESSYKGYLVILKLSDNLVDSTGILYKEFYHNIDNAYTQMELLVKNNKGRIPHAIVEIYSIESESVIDFKIIN